MHTSDDRKGQKAALARVPCRRIRPLMLDLDGEDSVQGGPDPEAHDTKSRKRSRRISFAPFYVDDGRNKIVPSFEDFDDENEVDAVVEDGADLPRGPGDSHDSDMEDRRTNGTISKARALVTRANFNAIVPNADLDQKAQARLVGRMRRMANSKGRPWINWEKDEKDIKSLPRFDAHEKTMLTEMLEYITELENESLEKRQDRFKWFLQLFKPHGGEYTAQSPRPTKLVQKLLAYVDFQPKVDRLVAHARAEISFARSVTFADVYRLESPPHRKEDIVETETPISATFAIGAGFGKDCALSDVDGALIQHQSQTAREMADKYKEERDILRKDKDVLHTQLQELLGDNNRAVEGQKEALEKSAKSAEEVKRLKADIALLQNDLQQTLKEMVDLQACAKQLLDDKEKLKAELGRVRGELAAPEAIRQSDSDVFLPKDSKETVPQLRKKLEAMKLELHQEKQELRNDCALRSEHMAIIPHNNEEEDKCQRTISSRQKQVTILEKAREVSDEILNKHEETLARLQQQIDVHKREVDEHDETTAKNQEVFNPKRPESQKLLQDWQAQLRERVKELEEEKQKISERRQEEANALTTQRDKLQSIEGDSQTYIQISDMSQEDAQSATKTKQLELVAKEKELRRPEEEQQSSPQSEESAQTSEAGTLHAPDQSKTLSWPALCARALMVFVFLFDVVLALALCEERWLWLESNNLQRTFVRDLLDDRPYAGWAPPKAALIAGVRRWSRGVSALAHGVFLRWAEGYYS